MTALKGVKFSCYGFFTYLGNIKISKAGEGK